MAQTPGGLPYPVGTDFVVDGRRRYPRIRQWRLTLLRWDYIATLRRLSGLSGSLDAALLRASTLWQIGTGLTAKLPGAASVDRAGLYRVDGFATFTGNSGGARRGISI